MSKFIFEKLGTDHDSLNFLNYTQQGKKVCFEIEGISYKFTAIIGDITRGSMPDQEINICIDRMYSVEEVV